MIGSATSRPLQRLSRSRFRAMACGTPSTLPGLARFEELVTPGESAYPVDITRRRPLGYVQRAGILGEVAHHLVGRRKA
jgi:hypothetical protein